jgi:hypothetical protein
VGEPSVSERLEHSVDVINDFKEATMLRSLLVLLLLSTACAYSQAITATLLGTVTEPWFQAPAFPSRKLRRR